MKILDASEEEALRSIGTLGVLVDADAERVVMKLVAKMRAALKEETS
jgi:hypothetical protein